MCYHVHLLTRIKFLTGTEPDPLPTKDLLNAGVQSFGSGEEKDKGPHKDPATQIDSLISKLENDEGAAAHNPLHCLLPLGLDFQPSPRS